MQKSYIDKNKLLFVMLHSTLTTLKSSNIKPYGFPDLRANGVKATNTCSLVPHAKQLQDRAVGISPSANNKHLLRVIQSLATCYAIMYG